VPALKLDSGDVLTEGPAILQFIADTNKSSSLRQKAVRLSAPKSISI